jgi:hypothetical protein
MAFTLADGSDARSKSCSKLAMVTDARQLEDSLPINQEVCFGGKIIAGIFGASTLLLVSLSSGHMR